MNIKEFEKAAYHHADAAANGREEFDVYAEHGMGAVFDAANDNYWDTAVEELGIKRARRYRDRIIDAFQQAVKDVAAKEGIDLSGTWWA